MISTVQLPETIDFFSFLQMNYWLCVFPRPAPCSEAVLPENRMVVQCPHTRADWGTGPPDAASQGVREHDKIKLFFFNEITIKK